MKPPENLGLYLERRDLTTEEKLETCAAILDDWGAPLFVLAKAATWLAYRAMESGDDRRRDEAAGQIWRVQAAMTEETNPFFRARWSGSLGIALAYLQILSGIDPRATLRAMNNFTWIATNPTGAVNVCRAMALLAAAEARAGQFRASEWAIRACHQAYRFSATQMKLTDVANCAGWEVVLIARAVHITVALLPHCHQPYQGERYGESVILAIDTTEPFNGCLRSLLPATCIEPPPLPPDTTPPALTVIS